MNVKIAFEDKKRISSRCYSKIRIYIIRKSISIYYVEKEEVQVLLLFSCLVETKGNKLHLCAFYFSTREVANFVAFKTSLEESLEHKTRQYIRVKKQDTIGSSLCRFYILCLDVANETFRFNRHDATQLRKD